MLSFTAQIIVWLYKILAILQIATRGTGNQLRYRTYSNYVDTNSENRIIIFLWFSFGFHLLSWLEVWKSSNSSFERCFYWSFSALPFPLTKFWSAGSWSSMVLLKTSLKVRGPSHSWMTMQVLMCGVRIIPRFSFARAWDYFKSMVLPKFWLVLLFSKSSEP